MDFNATVDLIIKELDEARDIIDDLKNYPGVPEIQVELAKSKCKSAAEVIALLKKLRKPVESVEEKPTIKVEVRQPENKPEIKPAKPEPVQLPEPPAEKAESRQQTAVKEHESAIMADKFGLTARVNERMGNRKEDDGVSEIMKSKPLTNLREAIGINDKFLFIRELFMGNTEAYTQAIAQLDNSGNLEEARSLIRSFAGNYKDTEAAKQLLDLVKRKFASHE